MIFLVCVLIDRLFIVEKSIIDSLSSPSPIIKTFIGLEVFDKDCLIIFMKNS